MFGNTLIAYNGADWLALMRGKFAEMGMEPRLDKPGARRVSYNGVTIIGDEVGAMAFLNPTTALAGRYEVVLRALEQRNNNTGCRSVGETGLENPGCERYLVRIGWSRSEFSSGTTFEKRDRRFESENARIDYADRCRFRQRRQSIAETVHGSAKTTGSRLPDRSRSV